MKKKTLLGRVTVDSGQLIIVDPCRLKDFINNEPEFDEEASVEYSNEFSYRGCCIKSSCKNKGGNIGGLLAVAFESGYGDGTYPIYAEYTNDNRIKKITIELIEFVQTKTKPKT